MLPLRESADTPRFVEYCSLRTCLSVSILVEDLQLTRLVRLDYALMLCSVLSLIESKPDVFFNEGVNAPVE